MFRDLKEYQELQKLYEEKVSKTENLQEFKSKFSKPYAPVKSPMEAGMGPGAAKAREMAKARIAAKNVDNKKIDTKVDTLANKDNVKADPKPADKVKVDPKPKGANIDTSKEIESSSAEFKANEGDKFNQNFKKQNSKPTFQKNRDKLNQSRQNQNKDRFKNQLGGVKKAVGSVASGFKGFVDKLKAKPIERKEGQTSVRQRSNVKTKSNTQNNKETTKIIPKTNTGSDIENKSDKITPKPNTGTDTENKSDKITPKPNTGTDTETKTNTQIKKMPGSGKEIDPRANVSQTTSTNDQGQKVTTTKTNLSLTGKDAAAKKKEYEEMARKRRENLKSSYQYDAYDIVLEYLLSTEQAATIEEANYIMTEMDAKTIQDIVSQQLNEQN